MSSLPELLEVARVLRAAGLPAARAAGAVGDALLEAERLAAERPELAAEAARARAAWPDDPWLALDHLEQLENLRDPRPRERFRRLFTALLAGTALLAAGWGAWVWANRPAPDEGLFARYHSKRGERGLLFERVDPSLEHDWKKDRPLPELPVDEFSVSWRGCLVVPEKRWLHAGADDSLRITVDGALTLDRWGPHGAELVPAGELEPGVHPVIIQYEELGGFARVFVKWSRTPTGAPESIPASMLVPPGGNRNHPCPP
jgi:hypothetical protein